jgi:hypothetical protein
VTARNNGLPTGRRDKQTDTGSLSRLNGFPVDAQTLRLITQNGLAQSNAKELEQRPERQR